MNSGASLSNLYCLQRGDGDVQIPYFSVAALSVYCVVVELVMQSLPGSGLV